MNVPDVVDERDIREVVETFYGGIESDPWLGHFFADVDVADHMPRMVAFWSAVVFQTGAYRGSPLEAHFKLEGLTPYHFTRWLERFHATVDARFNGPAASRMKARAEQIAGVMQVKLNVT